MRGRVRRVEPRRPEVPQTLRLRIPPFRRRQMHGAREHCVRRVHSRGRGGAPLAGRLEFARARRQRAVQREADLQVVQRGCAKPAPRMHRPEPE